MGEVRVGLLGFGDLPTTTLALESDLDLVTAPNSSVHCDRGRLLQPTTRSDGSRVSKTIGADERIGRKTGTHNDLGT